MLTFNDKVHQEYFQPKIEKIWHDINFMVKKIQYLGQSLYYSEARSSLINELPIQGINYETEASQELLDLLQRSGPSYKQNGAINPLA